MTPQCKLRCCGVDGVDGVDGVGGVKHFITLALRYHRQ